MMGRQTPDRAPGRPEAKRKEKTEERGEKIEDKAEDGKKQGKQKVQFQVTARGTVHRDMQDFEGDDSSDDDEVGMIRRGRNEVRRRYRQDQLVLTLSAAEVLEHAAQERTKAVKSASVAANSASGIKRRHADALTVASWKRNAVDLEVVQEIHQRAEKAEAEREHRKWQQLHHTDAPDEEDELFQLESHENEHLTEALRVVMARSTHRRLLDEGRAAHQGALDIGKRYKSKSRMLLTHQFSLQVGQATLQPGSQEEMPMSMVGSMRNPISRASRRTPTGDVLDSLRSFASRLSHRVSGRWPGADLRMANWSEAEEEDEDDGRRRRRRKRRRSMHCACLVDGKKPDDWRERLLDTYPDGGMSASRLNHRFKLSRTDFVGSQEKKLLAKMIADHGDEAGGEEQDSQDCVMVCPTVGVSPALPKDMDTHMTSVHVDGKTIRFPSEAWAPPVQMWEPFVIGAILSLHFYQEFNGSERDEDIITEDPQPGRLGWHERHIEKFLKFTARQLKNTFPCPVLQEHLRHPYLRHEESRFYKFLAVYLKKKFEPFEFSTKTISTYVRDALFGSSSSPDGRTLRIFILSPYVLDFLRNEQASVLNGQYAELLGALKAVGLLAQNIVRKVQEKTIDVAKHVWSAVIEQRDMPQIDYEMVHQYLDNNLIQKRYGGYSLAKDEKIITAQDLMLLRMVGATLEEIVSGKHIEALLNAEAVQQAKAFQKISRVEKLKQRRQHEALMEANRSQSFESFFTDDDGEHQKKTGDVDTEAERLRKEEEVEAIRDDWEALIEQCVDPEDSRFMPLGISLVEAFLLFHGIVLAMDRRPDADGDGELDIGEGHQRILRTSISTCEDQHAFTAAVLIDLYMREKVDVWAWQLVEGGMAPDLIEGGSAQMAKRQGGGELDLLAGPISHIYRVFVPSDGVMWLNEAPVSFDTKKRGRPHWLEPYVEVAEEAFQTMEVPGVLGAESVWDAIVDRPLVRPTDEEADQYRLVELRFLRMVERRLPRLWRLGTAVARGLKCLFPCCFRCCKRRNPLDFAKPVHRRRSKSSKRSRFSLLGRRRQQGRRSTASSRISGVLASSIFGNEESEHTTKLRHQMMKLEVYEFVPPELPEDLDGGPVSEYISELEAQRRRARGRHERGDGEGDRRGGSSGGATQGYEVGDKVELWSETRQSWQKAKIAKVGDGWVTVTCRKRGGGRGKIELPEDNENLRKRVPKPVALADDEEGGEVQEQLGAQAATALGDAGGADRGAGGSDGGAEELSRSNTESRQGSKDSKSRRGASAGGEGRGSRGLSGFFQSEPGGEGEGGADLDVIVEGAADGVEEDAAAAEGAADEIDGAEEDVPLYSSTATERQQREEEERKAWWERLKLLYCDSYYLMFEEGALYYDEEKEVALWRAQVLMFFFCLQALFEAAAESRNGFERVIQAVSPPFAKLPLQPPRGMEAAGAIVRGIIERARLARDEPEDGAARNLAVEAGEFQENMRSRFETSLFASGQQLMKVFDTGGDGKISLQEFIQGCQELPTKRSMQSGGMPDQVLDGIIRDLATDLFFQIDDDGSGALTMDELRGALEERRREAQERLGQKGGVLLRVAANQYENLKQQIPGTKEHRDWIESKQMKREEERKEYEKMTEEHRRKSIAEDEQLQFEASCRPEEYTVTFDERDLVPDEIGF